MDQPYSSPFQRALSEVLRDQQFTPLELADVANCSDRHIRRIANGQTGASEDVAGSLSRYLCRHDEYRCSNAFNCNGVRSRQEQRGEADGEVDDDLGDLMEAIADMRRAFHEKNGEALADAADRAEHEIIDVRAEGRHMDT